MDYTAGALRWKIKKVRRYVQLYGPLRTAAKIRAHYHMKRQYSHLPRIESGTQDGHVGIIGCGKFAHGAIAYYLKRNFGKAMRGCMDIDIHRAASLRESFGLPYYTDDANVIISDPHIDLVYIASNHASHAEYAITALKAGKAVHVEKPHCVTEDQLRRLCAALRETRGKISLGFNRPESRFGKLIREHLNAQEGAAMLNWFIAGHRIDPDHWYFKEEEGGRILGNLCHWTDFVYQMVPAEGRFPIAITPTRAALSDTDIAVSYLFGDGSIAVLTFSAKGHTFEGVRERFAAHKGDLLVSMDDFMTLTLEVGASKKSYKSRYRDHGHEQNIRTSYEMVRGEQQGVPISYVWETGLLILKTREALERQEKVVVESFARSF